MIAQNKNDKERPYIYIDEVYKYILIVFGAKIIPQIGLLLYDWKQ